MHHMSTSDAIVTNTDYLCELSFIEVGLPHEDNPPFAERNVVAHGGCVANKNSISATHVHK